MTLQKEFETVYIPPWRTPYKTGFVAGAFDIIHPGYIAMLSEAKSFCEYLVVALHEDPSIGNPSKVRPVLSLAERYRILTSIKYIDIVYTYATERKLLEILKQVKPDVRFLGDDYKEGAKPITGSELNIPIHWIKRSEWSATHFKQLIYEQMKEQQ